MMQIQETITYGLKVILSTKHEIQIDPQEVKLVMQAISSGSIVKVKKGIINPSYVVAVVEDEERKLKWLEDTKYDSDKRLSGMKHLQNIFYDRKLLTNNNSTNDKPNTIPSRTTDGYNNDTQR